MDQEDVLSTEDEFEQLKSKHCKERKELQAKLTALKHGITKNDKKRKKEISQQREQMEREMNQRHEMEVAQLKIGETKAKKEMDGEETRQFEEEEGASENLSTDKPRNGETVEKTALFFKELKLTKTQLKKEKKRTEKANARSKAEAEDAENAANSQGSLEYEAIRKALHERALELVEVSPDGDCLYSALANQANALGLGKFSASEMRRIAADYILKHREDFLPFLAGDENYGTSEEAHFEEYCSKVARMCVNGGSWGGEPELHALSLALRNAVDVIHADGKTIKFGEVFSGRPLILTFHKYAYTLGEHYNSTKPIAVD